MAVSLGYVINLIVGEAMFAHHVGVHAEICRRVVATMMKGGTLPDMRHPPFTSTQSPTFESSWNIVLDDRMTLAPICTLPAIVTPLPRTLLPASLAVMPHMAVGHDEVMVTDQSPFRCLESAVNNHVLAYHVVIADGAMRLPTLPSEILGIGTDHSALIHFVAATQTGTVHYARVWHNLTIIAYNDILVDERKRMNCNVVADLCRRINMG